MIALSVNGTWLELTPGTSLNLSLTSPIFDLESIERLYSFPFTLPLTESNRAVFRHAHRLDSRDAARLYDAELHLAGIPFATGVLRVTGRSNAAIEVAFQNDQMDWVRILRSTRLRELPGLVKSVTEYRPLIELKWGPHSTGDTKIYLLEVNGLDYSGLTVSGIATALNANFGAGFATYTDAGGTVYRIAIDTSIDNDIVINLTPTTVFAPGVEYMFPVFDPTQTDAEDAVLTDWAAHLAAVLATPDDHVFPVVYAPEFFNKNNEGWLLYINHTDTDGVYSLNAIGDDLEEGEDPFSRGWPRSVVPMPFMSSILETAFALAGATQVAGNFTEIAEVYDKLIVFNNRTLDTLYHPQNYIRTVLGRYYKYQPLNGFAESYNLADHLPDISAHDLLIWMSSTYALTYSVKGGRATIRTVESQLEQLPEDWTDRIEPQYSAETAQYDGYTLDYERQGNDDVVTDQLEPLSTPGEDIWQHKSRFFSLYHRNLADSEREWLVPEFTGKASSPATQSSEAMPAILLHYHDVQEDSAGNEYPLATHHQTNYAGESLGDYTLNWKSTEGLYNRFWEKYVSLLTQGVPCKRVARLTTAQLLAWRDNPARPVYIYHPDGATIGVIRQINTRISTQQQTQFLCELDMLLLQ